MITYDTNLQLALDLVGVFVFALSGGLVAVKKGLDLFGVLVLAGAAALGGGVVRDVLIGSLPPVGISDWRLMCSALVALLGSTLIVTAQHFGLASPVVLWGCVVLVFALRMMAVVLDVHAPKPLRTGEAR